MPTLIRAKKSVKLRQVLLFKRGQLNQAEAFFGMSNATVNRPTSCSRWAIRSAASLDCLSVEANREVSAFSTSCCFHFESWSSLRLGSPPAHFCLGTFTAEGLKNNLRFKLGGEASSFSFRHRILLIIRL